MRMKTYRLDRVTSVANGQNKVGSPGVEGMPPSSAIATLPKRETPAVFFRREFNARRDPVNKMR
jgi:hypothetical protein